MSKERTIFNMPVPGHSARKIFENIPVYVCGFKKECNAAAYAKLFNGYSAFAQESDDPIFYDYPYLAIIRETDVGALY